MVGYDGTNVSMPTAAATPARAPVTWGSTLKVDTNDIAARSWTFTIRNNTEGIDNMGGASGSKIASEYGGGFYPGDLEMTLEVTVPSADSAWIAKRLGDPDTTVSVSTYIDGLQVLWSGCRLRMDQSQMTSDGPYDETLVFDVTGCKCAATYPRTNLSMGAPPDDGNRSAGTDLDMETGLPSGDEEQRRGRWPRWSPTTTPTWTRATPSPTRGPTP